MAQGSEQRDLQSLNKLSDQLSGAMLKRFGINSDELSEATELDGGAFLVSEGINVIVVVALTSWAAGCVGACMHALRRCRVQFQYTKLTWTEYIDQHACLM